MRVLKSKIEVRKKDVGEWNQKPRIYVFPPEYTVLENLENRRERPYQEWKKLIPEVIEKAKTRKGGDEIEFGPNTKVRWSQKAGCSCGCSPGFIVDAPATPWGVDIFVELVK